MYQNYLKIALRNLGRNKLHSFINILGLAIGFMVAILSFLYIQNELNYEADVPENERIYRVYRQNKGQESGGWTYSPPAMAPALAADVAGIETATKIYPEKELLFSVGDKAMYLENIAFVDSAFFHVFNFPFKVGNPQTAIAGHNSVVITERIGRLLFGEEDPYGQSIRVNGESGYIVNGVLKNKTSSSFIDQEVFVSVWEGANQQWLNNSFTTYIKKDKEADITDIAKRAKSYLYPIYKREFASINIPFGNEEEMFLIKLQPLSEIHLYSEGLGGMRNARGDLMRLYIFAMIALVVLLIAGINYVNLSTARGANRAKEVGMRKVSGAHRGQLVSQFLLESVLQSLFALGIALVLSEFFLPIFNDITSRELSFFAGDWTKILLPAIAVSIFIGITAGLYPAFFLSQFKTIKVLKGGLLKTTGGQTFRKALVVSQFTLSVVLIIVMFFVFKQVNYMQNKELGFDPEQVMVIDINRYDSWRKFEQIQSQFKNIKGVESFALSNELPGERLGNYTVNIEGNENVASPDLLFLNGALDKTLGLEMKEGRFFSPEYAMDTINSWVVNETFIRQNNITNPIGRGLKFVQNNEFGRIIGVVKDFHFVGLQSKIAPVAMTARRNMEWFYKASFKLNSDNLPETIAAINKTWAQIEPEHPIRYTFLDERFAEQYKENESFGRTMLYATGLAIFIAMLGLFGLASFMAVQRTKEIGVRKVLGASVPNLIGLLVKDFVKLILIAGIIAVPIGYDLVGKWLEDFAFRTTINPLPFALAIFCALILAIVTVSYQAIKVSRENPVKALKTE